MHAAPSVSYPVGRSAFAGALYLLLAGAGLAAACAWTWQSHAPGWRQALGFALVLAASAVAAAHWLRSPRGRLHWAGGGWSWEEEGATGTPTRVELALDLQSRMLLRLAGEAGGSRWSWVERASDPSHWDALRRAVYSRASQ
jgi:toxin CptA